MQSLNLPPFDFKLGTLDGKTTIFDPIRKKYLVLTPEEWVRQHIVNFLTVELQYPRSLIKLEGQLHYNQMPRRSDVVTFNRSGNPHMLVECKAPGVKISQKVFDQAATYNAILKAKFLVVTNGLKHYCCEIDHERAAFIFLEAIPSFEDIASIQ